MRMYSFALGCSWCGARASRGSAMSRVPSSSWNLDSISDTVIAS